MLRKQIIFVPLGEKTIEHLGAEPGSLGAVNVSDFPIFADHALQGRTNMTTGANENDFHLSGVDIDRDITVGEWMDLREVQDGELCANCGANLSKVQTIEAGHIFKLGTKYAETFGAKKSLTLMGNRCLLLWEAMGLALNELWQRLLKRIMMRMASFGPCQLLLFT